MILIVDHAYSYPGHTEVLTNILSQVGKISSSMQADIPSADPESVIQQLPAGMIDKPSIGRLIAFLGDSGRPQLENVEGSRQGPTNAANKPSGEAPVSAPKPHNATDKKTGALPIVSSDDEDKDEDEDESEDQEDGEEDEDSQSDSSEPREAPRPSKSDIKRKEKQAGLKRKSSAKETESTKKRKKVAQTEEKAMDKQKKVSNSTASKRRKVTEEE
jgi:hypothetical protein